MVKLVNRNINQSGLTPVFLLISVLIISGIIGFFIFSSKKTGVNNPAPKPSPSISAYQKQKLESYDKYKEDIKSKLKLSEEEFQALKRFSAD